jgi:2-amino-4-hydroxy-6-hydroxymethyldihydropteridine diphosphokinase
MTAVVVALGSNLGDRAAHLDSAVAALRLLLRDVRVSRYVETAPVGVPDDQPSYLNAVVAGETALAADELLQALLRIEAARGRVRTSPRAARTLDLDLILYGDAIVDSPGLTVPHPRFRERRFVLGPLVEIAPDARDPVTGQSARSLLEGLGKPG